MLLGFLVSRKGGTKMKRIATLVPASLLLAALTLTAFPSIAGPAEEANAALDRFSAAYSANDVDALVQLYAPSAILLGTNSPIISEGRDAVRAYFMNLKLAGSGNKNQIQDRRTIVINDNAVVVTGFYEFTRVSEGKPVVGPARFTVLLTNTGGQWLIAHQHSSPRVMPKN
jgi:uncharacterized protein (TIGR02246 family)